jgi:ABC-type transport system involved in cytochrome c biogenesis permease subunit
MSMRMSNHTGTVLSLSPLTPRRLLLGALAAALLALPAAADERARPWASAAALDQQVDWSRARLLAIQHQNRHKTLDSFARESMAVMVGRDRLPGLSPLASLLEWSFNSSAYADEPILRVKDMGLRQDLTTHMSRDARNRIVRTGYFTPRELSDPVVLQRLREFEPRFDLVKAVGRIRETQVVALRMPDFLRIVPPPPAQDVEPWHTPQELIPNLGDDVLAALGLTRAAAQQQYGPPVPGMSSAQALPIVLTWSELQEGWQKRDAAQVQRSLDKLAELLPAVAPLAYPTESQRAAEARYYAMGKFSHGWMLYFAAMLCGVVTVVTGWRIPRIAALVLLALALGLHAYGLGLRWYILGRIPVANMWEAVVASAWAGVVVGVLVELVYRTGVFLVGAGATGFAALLAGQTIIPGQGALSSMMGILDDVMLRIHTTSIIAAYALIFLAAVIAIIYLFGYYFLRHPVRSAEVGLMLACAGLALALVLGFVYQPTDDPARAVAQPAAIWWGLLVATSAAVVALALLVQFRAPIPAIAGQAVVLLALFILLTPSYGFALGMSRVLMGVGAAWLLANVGGLLWQRARATAPTPQLALAGGGALAPDLDARPVLAGGAPGDDHSRSDLPLWLNQTDWSHLIVLNMAFVLLFGGGVVLGAVWADYSWGRPWGWDPKEVFALNTWLVYAILIHVRFYTRRRGLWTAWLSVLGCLMMLFNWIYVNFYLVGMHSYA